MMPEEKEAWDALIQNRMNPAQWNYAGSRPHERPEPPITSHEFTNKITGDHIIIHHVQRGPKKKSGIFKNREPSRS